MKYACVAYNVNHYVVMIQYIIFTFSVVVEMQ